MNHDLFMSLPGWTQVSATRWGRRSRGVDLRLVRAATGWRWEAHLDGRLVAQGDSVDVDDAAGAALHAARQIARRR